MTSLPKPGDKIVLIALVAPWVIIDPDDGRLSQWLVRAQVRRVVRGLIMHSVNVSGVRRRDEGRTWAKGWEGEAADALRAQVRLQGGVVHG